jgi:amino acid transporter
MSKLKPKIIVLIISGLIILIAGIIMVQTGFATFEDNEPRVGLYIGGIFTIIGGVFLTFGGIIYLNFDGLKKMFLRTAGKVADAYEEERKQEKM